jgi:hypothetical protein
VNNQKKLKSTVMLVPATVTSGATATANLDCIGEGSVEVIVSLGALAGAGVAPASIKMLESDDTVVTNFSEITALSTGAAAVGASESVRFFVDRSNGNRKRYLRLAVTPGTASTNSNLPVSAIAFFDRSDNDPASTSGYGSNVVKEV